MTMIELPIDLQVPAGPAGQIAPTKEQEDKTEYRGEH
jgi:hypothetical protein